MELEVTLSPDQTAERIMECHAQGLNQMVGSLVHFSEAGLHLKKIRTQVDDFGKWIGENLVFSKKTAYQYIKLNDKVEAGLDLESGEYTSIRQCLGIDHDGEKSTYREANDKRFESIPGLSSKIQHTYKGAIRAKALHNWSDDEKRALATSLVPIIDIFNELSK